MDNPRPEKVAVVEEVRRKLGEADAALLTEYRGLNVAALAQLRQSLSAAGGEYKIYKNTLVRLAARGAGIDIESLLTGPTAIAFIGARADGSAGDPVVVAKALRDFARTNPSLVVKGGLLGERVLSAEDARALADVAPREELLARLAGGLAAPMTQFAGLLQALPRNFAYGLKALIDKGGSSSAATATDSAAPAAPDAAGAKTQASEATVTEVAEATTEAAAGSTAASNTEES